MEERSNYVAEFESIEKQFKQQIPGGRPRLNSDDALIDRMFQYQQKLQQRFTDDLDKLDTVVKNKCCKICFVGEEQDDQDENKPKQTKNPLISPCNCSGSSKYIHLDCLKKWLQSKMVVININDKINHFFRTNY